MKKTLLLTIITLSVFSCSRYDDSPIWDKFQDIEDRISRLEKLCKEMNANITALKTIVTAIQNEDYVTSVTTIMENGVEIGYTLGFSNGESVTIYHGKDGADGKPGAPGQDGADGKPGAPGQDGADGKDGHVPEIGVRKDVDGVYYWTLDGEWILGEDGEKIPANGKDGESAEDGKDGKDGNTPQVKIEDEYWYVSYDNGQTWEKLYKATGEDGKDGEPGQDGADGKDGEDGDSFFQSIDATSSQDYILITLSDGTLIKLPTWKAFEDLQTMVNRLNTNLSALQKIVEALNSNDYVISVTPIMENGLEIGYTLYFSKSDPINIYHGKDGADGADGKPGAPGQDGADGEDGKDGQVPVISVKQDTDGIYYWTVNGEWLLGPSGEKIQAIGKDGEDGEDGADGKDGIVPLTKIVDGYWYVSYDGGKTWEEEPLGPATSDKGDHLFKDISYDEEYVYITLADGETISLPRYIDGFSSHCRIDPVVISGRFATVSGTLNVPSEDLMYSQITVYYSANEPFNIYSAKAASTSTFDKDKKFSITLEDLNYGQKYSYSIYAKVRSEKMYGQVETFEIFHPYSVPADLNPASAVELPSANSFIVSKGGVYKFKAVKGGSNESVGSVKSAELLWESFGSSDAPEVFDLIEGTCYKDGYVMFKVADAFTEGNAVVAAKDADGNILWSWHLWLTDAPAGQVYYNEAGTMMDRNLGATSATPGEAAALGLLYQWGRKDPFLGSSSATSASGTLSTLIWPDPVSSDSLTGTIEYTIENPTTFISYNTMNYDWLYTDATAVDTTRWAVEKAPKSIYDPCPAGCRIPDGGKEGLWNKALDGQYSAVIEYDSANNGMNLTGVFGDDETIWYPSAGNLHYKDGKLAQVGSNGAYWSATPYSSTSFYASIMYISTNGRLYSYDYGNLARAYSVRCCLEEDK